MVFEHHNIKLDEVESTLNQGEYIAAKKIILKHMENELKGKAILSELRGYVDEYEKILKELLSDVDELADRTTPNRIDRRDLCKKKLNLARQQLMGITRVMSEAMQDFKE